MTTEQVFDKFSYFFVADNDNEGHYNPIDHKNTDPISMWSQVLYSLKLNETDCDASGDDSS